jgi:NADH-quinone oxidoreductase subunit G
LADTETSREATVTFKLNGTDVTVPKGWTVMQAVKRENVKVPHFCWHPGLSIAGVCRFCMVKVAGRPKLEIACNLQAVEGMEVNTTDDDVKTAHKWALEFHLVNHPLDCPICDQAGECGLQDYYMDVGQYKSQMTRPKVLKPKALKVGGDLVLDTERCILCTRCTRFEQEVTKSGALGIFDRGDRAVIGIYPGKKIEHNYTDNLVDICPVGAFTSKDFRFKQRVWFLKDRPSTCPGCSTGCQVDVFGKDQTRRFFRLKPRESKVNGHWMCDSGRQMYDHLNKENRLLFPYMKGQNNTSQRSTLDAVAADLKEKLARASGDQVALLVSAQYTNEEYRELFDYFVKTLGIKSVFQWRQASEDRESFDGILRRGDHNSNTKGLIAALKEVGISKEINNEFDQLGAMNPSLVIALAPEIPATFPGFRDDLAKLSELSEVSMWSCSFEAKEYPFATAIPMKGFAEKIGTVTNFEGKIGELAEAFPSVVHDACSVSEFVSLLKS